mgnify:CR=1 FL=1
MWFYCLRLFYGNIKLQYQGSYEPEKHLKNLLEKYLAKIKNKMSVYNGEIVEFEGWKFMKTGDKILVPNCIAFEKKSEAIAAAVVNEIHEKITEKMDGIYPNEFDNDEDNWKYEREYEKTYLQ